MSPTTKRGKYQRLVNIRTPQAVSAQPKSSVKKNGKKNLGSVIGVSDTATPREDTHSKRDLGLSPLGKKESATLVVASVT